MCSEAQRFHSFPAPFQPPEATSDVAASITVCILLAASFLSLRPSVTQGEEVLSSVEALHALVVVLAQLSPSDANDCPSPSEDATLELEPVATLCLGEDVDEPSGLGPPGAEPCLCIEVVVAGIKRWRPPLQLARWTQQRPDPCREVTEVQTLDKSHLAMRVASQSAQEPNENANGFRSQALATAHVVKIKLEAVCSKHRSKQYRISTATSIF